MSDKVQLMCNALSINNNSPCGCFADHPIKPINSDVIPLCWNHAQMLLSGWYSLLRDDAYYPDIYYRYYRSSRYGMSSK